MKDFINLEILIAELHEAITQNENYQREDLQYFLWKEFAAEFIDVII
jgi:hypothetical protein